TTRKPRDLNVHRRNVHSHLPQFFLRLLAHRTVIEDPQKPAKHEFPSQEHVAVNAQLVNESQILVDRFNSQRARVADGPEHLVFTLDKDLAAAWPVKPS